jgi:hypothetical protein
MTYNNNAMPSKIKDFARKKLWALSAGRCAICNKELTGKDGLNIGQECHIISSKPSGPRYMPDLDEYNDYDNFILLCANHHREIDTNVEYYTVDKLKQIKSVHEQIVEKRLKEHNKTINVLVRINSGDTLGNLIWGSHSWTIMKQINDPFIEKISMDFDEIIRTMMDVQDSLDLQDKLVFHNKLDDYIKILTEHNLRLYADTTKTRIGELIVPSVLIAIMGTESDFCVFEGALLTEKETST